MSKRFNDIMLVAWVILLVFNLIVLLYNPLKFNFLLLGFSLGFLINMLIVHPLLNSSEAYINVLNKIIRETYIIKSKIYNTKVAKTYSGKGDIHGRVNYIPKEFIGKKVEIKLK